MNDQIEIRLLGRLWVRLANGQVVPPPQWTSDKTTDLLRLLALRSGKVVRSASLIEKLWPDATPAAAASSLHAATMQIRKVLGKNSIMRHLTGLQLHGIWVDVTARDDLALEISDALGARDFARVVAAARQAEALYVDDFHASDDDSDWARDIRDELRAQRKLMLVDAAESAIELGMMRDAIELSTLAVGLDPCFEPAHRALMRAYAGNGEIDAATRTYERCRRNLNTALGVDPSPTTESVRQLLTSGTSSPGELALVSESATSTVIPAASVTFRVLVAQLEPMELEICQLMAVLDRASSAADVMDLLSGHRRTEHRRIEIEACMDVLARRGIFEASDDTYVFRDRTTQELFELWLRPSLQVRISERIAEQRILLTRIG